MPQSLSAVYVHLVFSTKDRRPFLRDLATRAALHAYLHRKEGDLSNAGYWYRRAGRRMPDTTLDAEWDALVAYIVG